MKKLILEFFASLIVLGGCTSAEPEDQGLCDGKIEDANYIGIEEALQNAEEHFGLVFGSETRAGKKVKDVETFRPGLSTRGGQADGLYGFYIVNYENNGGFAMLSADRRRDAVYAISDEGSLNLCDTIENKSLSWYLNDYVVNSGINILPLDSLGNKDDLNPLVPSVKTKTVICAPLLTSFLSRFHQRSPYNKYCFTESNEQALVGCLPLAVGTIIGFYEFPRTIDGNTFNWADMKRQQYHDGWSRLFEILGRRAYLDAEYKIDGTSANPLDALPTFRNLGYKNVAHISSFNESKLKDCIGKKQLVLCYGFCENDGKEIGHGWVIDGAYTLQITYNPNNPENSFTSEVDYYKCVWGWGGNANGYFRYSNGFGGTPYEREEGTEGDSFVWSDVGMVYGMQVP